MATANNVVVLAHLPLGELFDLYDDVKDAMDQLSERRTVTENERERAAGTDYAGWEG